VLDLSDAKAGVEQVRRAKLIWMGGGDQNRLMQALSKTGVPEAIREGFRGGAVVGGTSAGAAVMSKVMITGEADLDRIQAGATKTADGLGLWEGVIVDQHAVKRSRLNRLLSAVLDRPELVGVAIDEETAAVVEGARFEVMGKGCVVVVDARKAKKEAGGATGIVTHVLKAGMKWEK
jgi:cyanophycinase